MQNYTAATQMRALVEKEGLTIDELKDDERFRKLQEAREREKQRNAQEFQQTRGREVRYGHVVQLQHIISFKYISVQRQSAELNKDAKKVALDRDAGELGVQHRVLVPAGVLASI